MSLYCDDTTPQFYQAIERKARKAHECCECTAKIAPGEKYVYIAGKWDGDIQVYKQHLLCCQACEDIRAFSECIPFGSLKEYNDECVKGSKHRDYADLRPMLAKIFRRERAENFKP